MKSFKRNIWLAICLLLLCVTAMQAVAGNKPLLRDSSAIQARYFDQGKIHRYKSDPDFQYQVIKEPPSSLWDRFWEWFWMKIGNMLRSRTGRTTFKYSVFILAVLVLVLFVLQLRKMNAAGMFRVSKGGRIPFEISEEDIHAIDFDVEISRAVNDANYRLAVRLLYLQSLKKLSDLGFIRWQIDKTNISYLHEVSQTSFYPDFQQLTAQFEKNWYGNVPINQSEYENVSQAFQLLNGRIMS